MRASALPATLAVALIVLAACGGAAAPSATRGETGLSPQAPSSPSPLAVSALPTDTPRPTATATPAATVTPTPTAVIAVEMTPTGAPTPTASPGAFDALFGTATWKDVSTSTAGGETTSEARFEIDLLDDGQGNLSGEATATFSQHGTITISTGETATLTQDPDPLEATLSVTGHRDGQTLTLRMTSATPLTVTSVLKGPFPEVDTPSDAWDGLFNAATGAAWPPPVAWDGSAYTLDDTQSSSNSAGTSVTETHIHIDVVPQTQ